MGLRTGYIHDDAFDEGLLQVTELHQIYFYQYGKKDGKPVIFSHGGPGTGCKKDNTIFFDPAIYRVVLLDQRGTGLSRPAGELRDNTTQALVSDIEALRTHLNIEKWHMVFGGSWGSTMSLAYAQAYPERCGSLVIRGVFLGTREENERHALTTSMMFPDAYDRYRSFIPEEKRSNIIAAYHELTKSDDYAIARRAAFEFERPEILASSFQQEGDEEEFYELSDDDADCIASSKICTHYILNTSFLGHNELLDGCKKIEHIPTRIAQGRMDLVCPPRAAFEVNKRLPKSELYWLHRAGHSAKEPDTLDKLVQFTDEFGKENFHLE